MRLISALPFIAVAILLQTVDVQGFNAAVWSNTETAEAVLNFFSEFLEYTGIFNSHQMNEIKEIRDTISVLMDQMILMKKTSSAMFQALDLAFASSIAKLIAEEDQGESLEKKKSAIFEAFKAALKYVTGTEDPVYLNEIKELVSMFTSQTPASATSLGSQAAISKYDASKTGNSAIPQENAQYFAPKNEVISPISVSQSLPQQPFNPGNTLSGAVSLNRGQSFDSRIAKSPQTLSAASSAAVVSSNGGQSFDSGIAKSPQTSSAASSAAVVSSNGGQSFDSGIANSPQTSSIASSAAVVNSNGGLSFDSGIAKSAQLSSAASSAAVVNSQGSQNFDSEILQNTQVSSAVSSAAEINPPSINEFNSGYPAVASFPGSAVLTAAQPLQAPNLSGPKYPNGEIAVPQQTNVAATVSTSADSKPKVSDFLIHGTSSDVVLSNDAPPASVSGENINQQPSETMNTATGTSLGKEFQTVNPTYESPAILIFADSLSDELYNSDTFYDVFESGISSEQAVSALIKLTKYVTEDLGLDDIVNELVASVQRYTSTLSPDADAAEYAVQYSTAIAEVLAKNEIITTETAIDDGDIFADSVEDFFAETPVSQLTAVVSTPSVGKLINEKDVVENYGSDTEESYVSENSPSYFEEESSNNRMVPDSLPRYSTGSASGRIDSVPTQNNGKVPVENYGSITDERNIPQNAPSSAKSKGISIAPYRLSRESHLSSDSALDRIDSVVSEIFTQERINSDNLGSIVSKLGSMIRSDRPDLSECEMLDRVYSEILSALIHVLNTDDYYEDSASYVDESAAIVSGAMKYLV